jgi:hypothetical protein
VDPRLPLTVLLVGILAGCSGDGSDGTAAREDCDLEPALCDPEAYLADHFCLQNDVRPRIYAPDTPGPDSQADPWRQGDYWTYRLAVDGRTQTTTLVYYDDIDFLQGKPQHYIVGTPTRAEALDHALFSLNPMIGRIHRTLYSPHESGAHADMFHFPLCDGSTWSTRFYDTDWQMVARPQPVRLPGGASDPTGFHITGTAGDGSRLTLDYSPQAKWFTDLEVVLADGGEVSMVLTATGSGKTGRHEFLRAQHDEHVDLAQVGQGGVAVEREDGGEGPYDLLAVYLELRRTAGTGKVEAHLRDPDGTSRACVGIAGDGALGATQCEKGPLKAEVPYAEGTWRVTVEKGPLDAGTTVAGQAIVVSAYDRGGTV